MSKPLGVESSNVPSKKRKEYFGKDSISKKPPLPNKTPYRLRRSCDSFLATITNIKSPLVKIRKRKRSTDTMGTACTKRAKVTSVVSPELRNVPIQTRIHSGSRVAPQQQPNHTSAKTRDTKSRLSIERISLHGDSSIDVRERTPLEDINEHENVSSTNNNNFTPIRFERVSPGSAGSDSTASEDSEMIKDKQTSLPDSRSKDGKSLDTKRSCSHGDVQLKSSLGSGNLLNVERTKIMTRRTDHSPRHHSSENVLGEMTLKEKRRKRLPTIENGVHVLEADQVNYYQILEEIGRGSFGSVCKCLCHKDNKFYAMKIISKNRLMRKNRMLARHPKLKSNPLEPLQKEIAILKKMDHPNIVKLIEVIDDIQVDNVYMVFELMPGGVVIEVPTENYINEDKARQYFRDLVLGIEYLHYSKIIHRDIKPTNLLLDKNDRVKIADFGVSNMFEGDDDLLSKYAGSPAFQAPEVLNYESRDKYSGKAVDVWAMGVTLFCFLYGKCPFFSANMGELCTLIKTEPVSFPDLPSLNPQAHDLISRMLSKEAKCRINIAEIKEHHWVTQGGTSPLPTTEEHCSVIEVTDEEVKNSIKIISKLSSLVLVKSVFRGKSFAGSSLRNKKRHSVPAKLS